MSHALGSAKGIEALTFECIAAHMRDVRPALDAARARNREMCEQLTRALTDVLH